MGKPRVSKARRRPRPECTIRQFAFSLGEDGVAIASENKWYNAAYYDGNGNYFDYPTQKASPILIR